VKQKEIWPKDLVKYYGKTEKYDEIDFAEGSLDGTFIRSATIDPRSVRFSDEREWCLAQFVKDKLRDPLMSFFEKL
jgi:Fe-S-cluster formation regulator IscX/YfhJ